MSKQRFILQDCSAIEITNDVGDCSQHLLGAEERDAINAALAINRPLLIWGEPGIGKSQLARAAAKELKRVFIPFVADTHTESRDLLWSLDAVARLAEAQIQNPQNPDRDAVALEKFIVPGVLWWALNWKSAEAFIARENEGEYRHQPPSYNEGLCSPDNGVVVLIDEIDKADSSVPNGLLEALGANRFHPQGLDQPVESAGVRPLVIITTNRERSLPDAFVRRCLSLHLAFPEGESAQFDFLLDRAKLNFPDLDIETILEPAAEMLVDDRAYAEANNLRPLPGQAEYFDLLRGVRELKQHNPDVVIADLLAKLQRFTYQKHPNYPREPYSE
ncbi:AAA family ATPase [Thiothrix nivea]|uniref:AAA ATPase n=1 Tax=Thiothrix nivea (strain ATCC 35100 / DSM 5205 / JP2) TaxID=870187 RepID=A0A656HHQ2_THINJ|nr:MoxR family ATPase [Thiothrix nivea]EIJ35947.1 AAA ATPase [Thiothrix nivea DSM 5205]